MISDFFYQFENTQCGKSYIIINRSFTENQKSANGEGFRAKWKFLSDEK